MDWREELSNSITDDQQEIFIKFCTLLGYSSELTADHLQKAIGDKAFPIEKIETWQMRFTNLGNNISVENQECQKDQLSLIKKFPKMVSKKVINLSKSEDSSEEKMQQDKFLNNFHYNGVIKQNHSSIVSRKYIENHYFAILNKALNEDPWLINEASFEFILIHTYQKDSSEPFWKFIHENIYKKIDEKIDIHRICWKFLFLLHWLLRNGHQNSINDSYRQRPLLIELSKVKKCISPQCCVFAQLNQSYFALLFQKIEFHMENELIPGNLVFNEQLIKEIGSEDDENYYELCEELFDYMDKILNLQSEVFKIRGLTSNISSSYYKCILNPLKICIIESGQIYELIFHIMLELHSNSRKNNGQELKRFRTRFLNQFKQLRLFYRKCQDYPHLKDSIQIPELVDQPPDFTKKKIMK